MKETQSVLIILWNLLPISAGSVLCAVAVKGILVPKQFLAGGVTGLGYIGVDLVLDKDKGPLILEMNACPGLNIQIANRAGLLPRLQLVERRQRALPSIEDRIAFSRERFGA